MGKSGATSRKRDEEENDVTTSPAMRICDRAHHVHVMAIERYLGRKDHGRELVCLVGICSRPCVVTLPVVMRLCIMASEALQ